MRHRDWEVQLQAVRDHPDIVKAAITGSVARGFGVDEFSDLDLLVIARDTRSVTNIGAWLPGAAGAPIRALHLSRYCTVLFSDFRKLDIAIFQDDEPETTWVVQDYEVVKGGAEFEAELAAAATHTREQTAAHLNPDVSIDNILLLLVTAFHRVRRGELLSAHNLVSMASDMLIALEGRNAVKTPAYDLLDPRRRIESLQPPLASEIQAAVFVSPVIGVARLASYLKVTQGAVMNEGHLKVVAYLSEAPESNP